MAASHMSLSANPLPWLLAADADNPGVRYFALRDLLGAPADTPEVRAAQAEVRRTGPVPAILAAQDEAGFWVQPGAGYAPKYRGTLWSLLFLAQLGAGGDDPGVRRAIDYVFAHAQTPHGAFAMRGTPGTAIHCLWGNGVRAMLDLGVPPEDERLSQAIDGLARSVTGDGFGGYTRSTISGPGFPCAGNGGRPCAWGAVRTLWALAAVPPAARTPAVEDATRASVAFLLSHDVAKADYPYTGRISSSWFKFGYPLGYVTDVLLNLEALTAAGAATDPRLDEALALVLAKADAEGRWPMAYSYRGKMWLDVEQKGRPSKWVTLRALRVLKRCGRLPAEWLAAQRNRNP
jgi:hypothetical protein